MCIRQKILGGGERVGGVDESVVLIWGGGGLSYCEGMNHWVGVRQLFIDDVAPRNSWNPHNEDLQPNLEV